MRCFRLAAAIFALVTATSAAAAQISTPPRGSPLRAEILDAFRPTVEAELGAPVEFVIRILHVSGQWAYVEARPQRPGGRPIDYRRTKYRQQFQDGALEDLVLGLLQRSGGGWRVVDKFIGPTDVAWYAWVERFKLPERFFQAQ